MKATPKKYAQALFESLVSAKTEKEKKNILNNFFKVLVANNQISQSGRIVDIFEKMWKEKEGVVDAEIISANKLDKKTLNTLNSYISKKVNNKEVSIEEKVDKAILGGFVIRVGNLILDNSLKTRLRDFKTKIGE